MKNSIISTLCIISLLFSTNNVTKNSFIEYKKQKMGSVNSNENTTTKSIDTASDNDLKSRIMNDRSKLASKGNFKEKNIPENVKKRSEAYLKSIDKTLGKSAKGLELKTPLSKKYISNKNSKSIESLAIERSLNEDSNKGKGLRIKSSSNSTEEINSYLFEKRKNIMTRSKPKSFDKTFNHQNKSVRTNNTQSNVFQSINKSRLEKIKHFQNITKRLISGSDESASRNIYSLITISMNGPKLYAIAEIAETWEEAHNQLDTLRALYEEFDVDVNVHLATIHSQEEQDLIYQGIMDSTQLTRGLIGLTDEEVEGEWRWVTDEEFNYSNWRNGEPNNSGNGEDHVVLNMDAGGAWDDATGSANWNYVVELTLNIPNEPNLIFLPGEFNGSEYAVSYEPLSYNELPDVVEALDSQNPGFDINIVTITSPEENEFLSSGIMNNDTLPNTARYWIGLTDHEEEGNWRWWNSDEEVNYLNWRAGEPNGGTTENYAEMKADDGLWNDANEDAALLYILEGRPEGNESDVYLSGHVIDHTTGLGISGAYVDMYDQHGSAWSVETDEYGYYFVELPEDLSLEYETFVFHDEYHWAHDFYPAGSLAGGSLREYQLGRHIEYSHVSGVVFDQQTGESLGFLNAHIESGYVINDHQDIGWGGEFAFTAYPQDSLVVVVAKEGYRPNRLVVYNLQPDQTIFLNVPMINNDVGDPPVLENNYTWIHFDEENQKSYILSEFPRDWYASLNEIETLRELYDFYDIRAEIDMVAIGSEEENQILAQSVLDSTGNNEFFIGLTDEGDEGNWSWLNGEELLYTNWGDGEGFGGDRENFAVLHTPTGQWQDHGDGSNFNYLVEITFENNDNDDDFTWLGEFEGNDYYLSSFEETWYGGYHYVEDNMSVEDEDRRLHLATITSPEENNFLTNVLPDTGMFWIGFTDEINEGDWQWVTGEEVTYFNWDPGQPDESGDYAVINDPYGSGNWDDQPQDALRRFVVEVSTYDDDHEDDNMLVNGSFEDTYLGDNGWDLPHDWIGYPHHNSQQVQFFGDNIHNSEETFVPLEGDASLKMWGLFEGEFSENNIFQEWQDGELEPGTNFFVEAALMSHSEDSIAIGGNVAFLFVKYFGPNYEFLGMQTSDIFDGHHSTNNWYWKGLNAVVPENAYNVQVGAMLVQPTMDDHGAVYIDEFYMERTDDDDPEGELLYVGEFEGHYYYASTSRFLGSEVERIIDDLQNDNAGDGIIIYPVTISSEEENQFISNAIMNQWTEEENDTTLLIDDHWIGLSDLDEENLWQWYNGEELVYTNWAEGEPNGSVDDFAAIWPENTQWESRGDDFKPLLIELELADTLNPGEIFVDIINGSDEEGNGSFDFPFSSITRAVSEANNGDQILVAPGDYQEDVIMIGFEDVSIFSMDGPENTRLLGDVDENNLLPAIAAVESRNITIAGFTFTESSGGGVDAFLTEDLFLFDNNFYSNYTPNSGGGLWSFSSSVIISNCMFENNYAGLEGGGVYFVHPDTALVRLEIYNSEFNFNEADEMGGAVVVANMSADGYVDVYLGDLSIEGNGSNSHGGVLVHGPAHLAMGHVNFLNNSASEHSGALGLENYVQGFSDFGSFIGNHAENGHSGGVSITSGANFGLYFNTFANNHSASGAHLTALGFASVQMHGMILWDYGSGDGSGLMAAELDGMGGYISIHESNVWNGESSVVSLGLGFVEYDTESNIDVNPFFCNYDEGDFSLDEMTPAVTSDGEVMGAFGIGCSGNVMAPATIVAVDDIPEDQGGRVYVTFEKSIFDTDQPQRTEMYTIERLDGDTWVGLNSVGAYGSELYVVEATTLGDSTSADLMMSEFRVIANMDEGIFISEPHSGFSIDNIAPSRLVNLFAEHSNGIVYLNWDASDANDFSHYNIYHGRSQDFIPNSENLLGTHSNPNFEHDVAELGDHYYILSAVDIHENESEYSDIVSVNLLSLLDVHGIPEVYTLHQNFPNPFNPTTQIKYDLPEDALVNISIYDVMGRMIRSLSYGQKSAGYHSLQWDATNDIGESVSAGMYIYTIQAGDYRATKKMVLLK